MPEYSIDFSEKLIEAARDVIENGVESSDAKRAVLYLTLLSCEITMKALLERAGKPVKEIKERSHNLDGLLKDLGRCEVEEDIVNGVPKWVPAYRLHSKVVTTNTGESTVGVLLTGESQGASKYPNQIRYDDHLYHFPPEAVLNASTIVLCWAREKWDRIRLSSIMP